MAVREHIAAAAVSRKLRKLEYALDTQLPARINERTSPPAAGVGLAVLACNPLKSLDDIAIRMDEFLNGRREPVLVLTNISEVFAFFKVIIGTSMTPHPISIAFRFL